MYKAKSYEKKFFCLKKQKMYLCISLIDKSKKS